MKSKYTTYFLIIAVVIIWGFIVKKIFFSAADNAGTIQTQKSPQSISTQQADTLYLNYTDPFLKKHAKRRQQKQSATKSTLSQPQQKTVQHVNNISLQYVGYVKEKNSGTISYLIKINGVQHIIKQNDNIDGLKLTKVTADSLFLEKENNKYSIYIEK
jgi:phosphoribosylanthranilate isomerase